MRDYHLPPSIWDADPECLHVWGDTVPGSNRGGSGTYNGRNGAGEGYARAVARGMFCQCCGAWRGCLGLEPTPTLYVQHLGQIFAQVKRVLRPDGTVWLNIGDSYAATGKSGGGRQGARWALHGAQHTGPQGGKWRPAPPSLKAKDLCLIPFRLAIALQEAGWWVRSDIIWAKPNPMPESVTDRPTRSHEYVFMLTKSPKYFYDGEAVKEPALYGNHHRNVITAVHRGQPSWQSDHAGLRTAPGKESGRNLRSVWAIPTEPFSGARLFADYVGSDGMAYKVSPDCPIHGLQAHSQASHTSSERAYCACSKVTTDHFATMPTDLADICLRAGTSAHGACRVCGSPWRRVIPAADAGIPDAAMLSLALTTLELFGTDAGGAAGNAVLQVGRTWDSPPTVWEPSCTHHDAPVRPCVALDPFAGVGTTLLTAQRLQLDSIGIELNPDYLAMLLQRLEADAPLFARILQGEAHA